MAAAGLGGLMRGRVLLTIMMGMVAPVVAQGVVTVDVEESQAKIREQMKLLCAERSANETDNKACFDAQIAAREAILDIKLFESRSTLRAVTGCMITSEDEKTRMDWVKAFECVEKSGVAVKAR